MDRWLWVLRFILQVICGFLLYCWLIAPKVAGGQKEADE